ncbi:MAG: O-antigen ligase family protein [Candidatus Accumulibacter sp.]|nr:O-antigen ligase family protein [Accumulibacter sp.]
MIDPELNRSTLRQTLVASGAFALLWFSWASHEKTLFNGLASPLFYALTAYLCFLSTQYELVVSKKSLILFSLFAAWAVLTDARSGEFLPALAVDAHWFVVPLAVVLIARALREFPQTLLFLQIGAGLCIVNILLTMFFNAEWYDNWRHPPIFGHFRHMGLSIGFMTLLLCARDESTGVLPIFLRASRILGMAVVVWTSTRAALLAWAIAFPFFLIADRKFAATLVVDLVVAAVLAQIPAPPSANASGVGIIQRTLSAASPASRDILSGRLGIWESTLSALDGVGGLWSGLGGNGFIRLQAVYGGAVRPPGHVHAHNFVVQAVCDWGIVGTALFGRFFVWSTLKPIFADWRRNDPTALSGVIYILTTGMFDATLYHLEHINYLVFALAWLFSRKAPAGDRGGVDAAPRTVRIPAGLIVAILVGFVAVHWFSRDYRTGLGWYFPTQ